MKSPTLDRINLWSSPRNISTALMYSFAQNPEVRVVDEPLYAHYLGRQPTLAEHPGRARILASQNQDGKAVVYEMLHQNFGTQAVIFKQMTHHLVELELGFLEKMKNVLLIRDPRAILASYNKVVQEVSSEDIGVPQQYALFQRLRKKGHLQAIVDSRRLLMKPKEVLAALCERLSLNYSDDMLSWPKGGRPEDGVWATYWYANVHNSTGFKPYQEKSYSLSPKLNAIADVCTPLYEDMLMEAL
ncbi:MAG: hypothetical protein AAGA31_15825 [Bacteroidota bacterium]